MSDAQQTEAGRDFWQRQMVEATKLDLQVGLANLIEHTIEWFDGSDITRWLGDHADAWGKEHRHQGYRFVIAR